MSEVAKFGAIYLKLGSVYYPVACATNMAVDIDTEMIELAPRTSQDAREFIPGRYTGKITGSGLTKITASPDNLYTVFDLMGYQLNGQRVLVKYTTEDVDGNVKVMECNSVIEKTGLSKASGKASNHSFSLQITGPVVINSTPVENTNPQILIYEYTAAGSETELLLPFGDNATILVVYVNGVSRQVMYAPDGYTGSQVQYDSTTKILSISALSTDDYVKIIYVDVDVLTTTLREVGDGDTRDIGDGDTRDTA